MAEKFRKAFDINYLGNLGLLLAGVSLLIFALASRHSYQIVQLGDMARNQHLIDTKTGRVWNKTCVGKVKDYDCDGVLMWDEMYVSDLTSEYSRPAKIYDYVTNTQTEEAKKSTKN
jgi:hypothetical protein